MDLYTIWADKEGDISDLDGLGGDVEHLSQRAGSQYLQPQRR